MVTKGFFLRLGMFLAMFIFLDAGFAGPGSASLLPGDSETAHVRQSDSSPLFPVQQDGKWGYIDRKGTVVIEPRFDYAGTFAGGLAVVLVDEKYGYIGTDGEIVIEPQFSMADAFSEGLAAVQIGGSVVGIMGSPAQLLYADTVIFAAGSAESPFGNWSYTDRTGKVVTKIKFTQAYSFREGMAMVSVPDSRTMTGGSMSTDLEYQGEQKFHPPACGWIDRDGNYVIKPKFGLAWNFSDGLAYVCELFEGKQGYIDKTGKFVIQRQFAATLPFSEGLAAIMIGKRWGFIDMTGKIVINLQYDSAWSFSEGVAAVDIDGKWCYVDNTGAVVIEPEVALCTAESFHDGLAIVQVGDEDTGKWGFMNSSGKMVIEPQYNWIAPFTYGLAEVRIGDEETGKRGYIDKKGKYIWEPTN